MSTHIHEEQQYLDLCAEVIQGGIPKSDRTGTGTRSIFGKTIRYNLRNRFPLFTTKRVFWRGVVEELLWFLGSKTSSRLLAEKGVHIWDGNGSREYLDKVGLIDREECDLGPVYGFQWRHFGAEYKDCHTDYKGKGMDQLQCVIDTIRNNPNDRRMVVIAWNPMDLDKMALPPCHLMFQFYVDTLKRELSCMMVQRSCDLGLGVPFNVASYSLLLYMVAHVCDLTPGDFIHVMGDVHVYNDHVDALKEQCTRTPNAFPKLHIKRKVASIDDFSMDDFELKDYRPQASISMRMSV